LYLDMNGIVSHIRYFYAPVLTWESQVHPCTHPEGKVRPYKLYCVTLYWRTIFF
jgi:hypothetical protein